MKIAVAIFLLSSLSCFADSVAGPISDGSILYAWVGVSAINPIGYWRVDQIDPVSPHDLIAAGTVKKVYSNSDPRSVIPMP